MRLRLQGLCRCDLHQEGRAAEPLRAGRQGNRPHAEDAARGDRRSAAPRPAEVPPTPRRHAATSRGRSRHARATIRSMRRFVSRTRLNKTGSAKETWHIEFDLDRQRPRLRGRRLPSACIPRNDPALVDAMLKALDAPADFPIGGRTLARRADRRRLAVARARHAVPAVLLHHRRRAAAEGQGAGGRRRPGRRRRDARRAGGDREIPRRPARSRGLHRGARSAAAAALFDLVVAQGAPGPRVAHRRCGALRRSASAQRLGVASTFLAGRVEPGDKLRVYVQKAHALRPAGRSAACRSS